MLLLQVLVLLAIPLPLLSLPLTQNTTAFVDRLVPRAIREAGTCGCCLASCGCCCARGRDRSGSGMASGSRSWSRAGMTSWSRSRNRTRSSVYRGGCCLRCGCSEEDEDQSTVHCPCKAFGAPRCAT